MAEKQQLVLDVPGVQVTATLGGTAISGSQVNADFNGQNFIRLELDADTLALSVRAEYSTDSGSSWHDLCSVGVAATDKASVGRWFEIDNDAKTSCLARAVAVGATTVRVRFAEIQMR